MIKYIFHMLLFCACTAQAQPAKPGIRFFVDPATNSDDPEKRMAYGINITPPWADGGYFFINLPEHLWYMPDTKGIARHHDKRRNVWKVSGDGKEAGYTAESLSQPGVFLDLKARAESDRVHFEMTIRNNSDVMLKSISPLFCFQYHHLKGFPKARSDNFAHTYILYDGQPVALKDIVVDTPGAIARMAQVGTCKDESNWWAVKMGGMIEKRIDVALTALTASSDDRKVLVTWTPGKSILSNTVIPCIHADACIGDLGKGESRTIHGFLMFTRQPLEAAIKSITEDANTQVSN